MFTRITNPALTTTVAGPAPAVALAVPPGDSFLPATETWPAVPGTEQCGDQLSQYLYRVSVQ